MKKKIENSMRVKGDARGLKKLLYKCIYSFHGLKYAYKNESGILIHLVVSIITIIIGLFLKPSFTQWGIIFIALGVILSIELLNTAIEAVVDMVTIEYNELAKIAKDCGSAATFVVSVIGAITIGAIYVPKIIALFN